MGLTQTENINAAGDQQVSLAAETTKVIGTVNVAAAQTLATVTTVSAVTAITNALPAGSNVIGHVIVDSGTISATTATSATCTPTSVAGSATSVTLLASNASRKGFSIYNDSTAVLKVAFAASASATAFNILLQPNAYYENNVLYTGIITGIWASATGNARVGEFT